MVTCKSSKIQSRPYFELGGDRNILGAKHRIFIDLALDTQGRVVGCNYARQSMYIADAVTLRLNGLPLRGDMRLPR